VSATKRGSGVRTPDDAYETPAWCVQRLLEKLQLPGGNWLEPGAGDGAIIKAVGCGFPGVRGIPWRSWDHGDHA
jgi:hypothetical protein